MSINWSNLRSWEGSQNKAFEELCCQLAEYEQVTPGSKFIRKGAPDAGVECYRVLSNRDEWGWQAKFFPGPPKASGWQQIDDSVETALEKHPQLTRYYVCLPIDREDPRIAQQDWLMDKWNKHVEKWSSWAGTRQMSIEFEYWGEHEISERLSREEHRGRTYFWFHEERFNQEWFGNIVVEAIANAGPRYTPELNVDLPIARTFEGLGRTQSFFTEMKVLRGKLVREVAKLRRAIPDETGKEAFKALVEEIERLLPILVQAEDECIQQIDLEGALAAVSESGRHVGDCQRILWDAQEVAKKASGEGHAPKKGGDYIAGIPLKDLGYALHHLYELSGVLGQIHDFFGGPAADLANVGALLLLGEAGTGKTHLFCDVARQRIGAALPTVLMLGEHFSAAEPWSQLTHLLGLDCGRDDLLGALEAAAQARGGRALILIDGLNEGDGKNLWLFHLAGILTALRRFPRIGIALSVRSSYVDVTIPPGLGEDKLIRQTHHGFADYEYEATKTFFDYFGIERPAVPLLTPEFQNPMFLKLFCQGLKNRGLTRIPPGLHGISRVFEVFLDSVNDKLAQPKVLDFDRNERPVQRAVGKFAETLAERGRTWLPREEARSLLNAFLPREGHERSLFKQLISEGVFSVDRFWSGEGNEYEEGIRFSYERLTDYSVAKILLDEHLGPNDPIQSFSPAGPLAWVLKDESSAWKSSGLIEALSVQLPERLGKELAEVAPHCANFAPVRKGFILSLILRDPNAIREGSRKYINEHVVRYRDTHEQLLEAFLTVACIPGHPYNADFLHKHLSNFSLADRDAWWSIYLHAQYGDKGAVDRLVDWAWSREDKSHIEDESVRLAGAGLAWFLTTSNRYLRDRATKALVQLLTPRIGVLRRVLGMFLSVNDPYVLQRLCAVAYGCAMRSHDHAAIGSLAKDIFTWFFEQGTPPPDILMRDFARGVVETALHFGIALDFDPQKVRPPYKSEWPEVIPTMEDLEKFKEWHEGMPDEDRGRVYIYSSVMEHGDFGRYVIGTNWGQFEWSSRRLGELPKPTCEEKIRTFVESLTKKQTSLWRSFVSCRNRVQGFRFSELVGSDKSTRTESSAERLEKALQRAEGSLCDALGSAKLKVFRESIVPRLDNPQREADEDRFDLALAQRWILARVFELGWTSDRFGRFDRDTRLYRFGRGAAKPERIGKKYQWIAYHEFLARVADNFEFRPDSWSKKTAPFEGPWQAFTRDIDPSCLLAKTQAEEWQPHTNTWWFPTSYDAWDAQRDAAKWVKSSADLPTVEPLLDVEKPQDHSK